MLKVKLIGRNAWAIFLLGSSLVGTAQTETALHPSGQSIGHIRAIGPPAAFPLGNPSLLEATEPGWHVGIMGEHRFLLRELQIWGLSATHYGQNLALSGAILTTGATYTRQFRWSIASALSLNAHWRLGMQMDLFRRGYTVLRHPDHIQRISFGWTWKKSRRFSVGVLIQNLVQRAPGAEARLPPAFHLGISLKQLQTRVYAEWEQTHGFPPQVHLGLIYRISPTLEVRYGFQGPQFAQFAGILWQRDHLNIHISTGHQHRLGFRPAHQMTWHF